MGNVIDVAAVMRQLGPGSEQLAAMCRHRSTLTTSYVFDEDMRWTWRRQPPGRDALAGLVFIDVPISVDGDLGEERAEPGSAVFLHPHRDLRLSADVGGSSIGVWLPWDSLLEVETGVQSPGQVLAPTPLTVGLRAFLTSLLMQLSDATPYTDYLVERVLAEMAFGALLESVPKNVAGAREDRPIDRARSLMLMRRAEGDFGVAELAQEMHMSTRHLQRMFAAENSSPADELRGMRIDLANELLGDPAYDSLSIGEIAMHAGLRTPSALRRAFAGRGLPLPARARSERMPVG